MQHIYTQSQLLHQSIFTQGNLNRDKAFILTNKLVCAPVMVFVCMQSPSSTSQRHNSLSKRHYITVRDTKLEYIPKRQIYIPSHPCARTGIKMWNIRFDLYNLVELSMVWNIQGASDYINYSMVR